MLFAIGGVALISLFSEKDTTTTVRNTQLGYVVGVVSVGVVFVGVVYMYSMSGDCYLSYVLTGNPVLYGRGLYLDAQSAITLASSCCAVTRY